MIIIFSRVLKTLRSTAIALSAALLCASVSAAVFTVNNTGDASDADPGDGICATTGNVCTLRAAIEEANALAGSDTINIPAITVVLATPLLISTDVFIDGSVSSGAVVTGNDVTRVIEVSAGANVYISNVQIARGRADQGAGLRVLGNGTQLTLFRTSVQNNVADSGFQQGGGIYIGAGATVFVLQSSIIDNAAPNAGGGVRVASGGALDLRYSTVARNSATVFGASGGGVQSQGAVSIVNSTIAANRVGGTGAGIGIDGGSAVIEYTTIAQNTSDIVSNPQLYRNPTATLTLRSVLISDPASGINCANVSAANSLGNNLDSGNSCGFTAAGDLSNSNARLGTLGSCAGLTAAYALQPGSAAIDAGPAAGTPTTDQSNTPSVRVTNAPADIGACEFVRAAAVAPVVPQVPVNAPYALLLAMLLISLAAACVVRRHRSVRRT